jgi:Kef-type K+ transport system membrane component KefB
MSAQFGVVWHLVLALAAVIAAGRALGRVCTAIGQPPVIGEVLAGILLGPSLLGRVAPSVTAYLFPADIVPALGSLAQLGVVIYMFLIGLELDLHSMRSQLRTTLVTSLVGIVVPFALGAALAGLLHPRFGLPSVPFAHFALFLGIALSITAFPVLARILSDQGMTTTTLGVLALTCAAVGDVTAWCLLAFVVGVVRGSGSSALSVAVLTGAFVAVMVGAVRPFFERVARAAGPQPTWKAIAAAFAWMAIAALTTEAIGIHAIFGAFLLGAVVPHDSGLARTLTSGAGGVLALLLLPAFFAFTGLRTEIGLVSGPEAWLAVALVIAAATVGKLGGTSLAARVMGLDWRRALGLGVLMNTRGLMELIVLNVGLDLGVISPAMFAMLVLMAIVTTVGTAPLLAVVRPWPDVQRT